MEQPTVAFEALSLNGSFRILDLPLELFSSVCTQLDDASLQNIRLVSRAINDRSTFTFGTRFLTHLVAMTRPDSLGVLLHYANHQNFSRFVKTLSISAETGPPSTTYVDIPASRVEDMLTEALHSFENLETIRLDNCSYLRTRYLSPDSIGLRCGAERLDMEQLSGDFTTLSNLFHVVTMSASRAKICDRVHLDLNLHITYPPPFRYYDTFSTPSALFDLSMPSWKENLSSRVRRIDFIALGTGEWAHSLAASCSSLQELNLQDHNGKSDFYNAHRGLQVWKNLRSITAHRGYVENAVITNFFKAHQGTLTFIALDNVYLRDGTWGEILRTFYTVATLERISLDDLGQDEAGTAQEVTKRSQIQVNQIRLRCSNRSEILRALGSLLPVAPIIKIWGFAYRVDFAPANAALRTALSTALPDTSLGGKQEN